MKAGMAMMIKLEHVNKYFGTNHVLKDVNLEVQEGEKLVIIGPSGSGKSTTVRCMNFLEEPTEGHVYINGTELTRKNRTQIIRDNMSMVFQQFNLYPHMTVLQNLTMAPMKLRHKSREDAEKTAYHYLEVVGLRHKANVYPTTLSGGQQRQAVIARAILQHPDMIVMDEPTNHLDYGNQYRVIQMIEKLADQGMAVILTTHMPDHALYLGKQTGLLLHKQLLCGTTEEVITEDHLQEIYHIPVKMIYVKEARRVICVPGE